MPKIVGTRERVHQPFYDSLIRTDGASDLRVRPGLNNQLSARVQLFLRSGAELAVSNLTTGGTFPSDQTFIMLAVRVWTYFRFNAESSRDVLGTQTSVGSIVGAPPDRIMRVHKLYHQTENQIFWQFQAGDKPQFTAFTAYTPMAGGLDGFFAGAGQGSVGGGGSGGGTLLGGAADFMVLAAAGITNVGATVINGNVGVGPTSPTATGFPPGLITGTLDIGAGATAAQVALTAAVVTLNGMPATALGVGDLGGLTIPAGVWSNGAVGLTGILTLDGGGDPNAVFVFQIGTWTIAPGASIVLINGANAGNVYFVSTGAILINTTASLQGNLIAQSQITFANGSNLIGRAFAQTADITFINNQLTAAPNAGGSGGVGVGGFGGANGNSLPRANNGIPTSSALMRLARPILIPPRQGFQCIATLANIGNAQGASLLEQLQGQLDGSVGPASAITSGALSAGNLTVNGADDVEKDVKFICDGLHSRDVL